MHSFATVNMMVIVFVLMMWSLMCIMMGDDSMDCFTAFALSWDFFFWWLFVLILISVALQGSEILVSTPTLPDKYCQVMEFESSLNNVHVVHKGGGNWNHIDAVQLEVDAWAKLPDNNIGWILPLQNEIACHCAGLSGRVRFDRFGFPFDLEIKFTKQMNTRFLW